MIPEWPAHGAREARRWLVLVVIAIAQLMIILDLVIVNVALPSAQRDLGFSTDVRQWIITAYALSFGSLLLLGGRLGDLFGRKWAFLGGLIGFAAASAAGGAATSLPMLVAARAAQGAFAAVLAPAALALVATTFTDQKERATAFGIFGAIAGAGEAAGLLLGGVFTQLISWRWCLYVNLAFAVPAAAASVPLLKGGTRRERPPLDLKGAAAVSAGLLCLIVGFSRAETDAWADPVTVATLAGSVLLVVAFVVIESRVAHPLLPLRVLTQRTRAGSYLSLGLANVGLSAVFLFLTYYLQSTRGFSPIETGLAFLPLTAAITGAVTLANTVLLRRLGLRCLLVLGLALGAGAMIWLAQLGPSSGYGGHVLPALVVMGLGIGTVLAPAYVGGTSGVQSSDAGVASGVVNAAQQLGNAIGPVVLSTIFITASAGYVQDMPPLPRVRDLAAIHGYSAAFYVSAATLAAGAVLVATILRHTSASTTTGGVAGLSS